MAQEIVNLVPSKVDTKIDTNKLKIYRHWQVSLLIVLHLPRALSRLVLIASRKSDVLT